MASIGLRYADSQDLRHWVWRLNVRGKSCLVKIREYYVKMNVYNWSKSLMNNFIKSQKRLEWEFGV